MRCIGRYRLMSAGRLGDFEVRSASHLVVGSASGLVVGAPGGTEGGNMIMIIVIMIIVIFFEFLHLLTVQLKRGSHMAFLILILHIPWLSIAVVVKSHEVSNVCWSDTSILKVDIRHDTHSLKKRHFVI